MPTSSSRKKSVKPSQANLGEGARKEADAPNPAWFAPVMFGFMLLGLVWIITYYVTGAQFPLGSFFVAPFNIGNWNIAVGFGIALVGFIMSTRWK